MKSRLAERLKSIPLGHASPEAIALSIVLGLMLGVFPVYGCPTLLCLAAGAVLRPNVPLLQAINAITSPLQLALLLPFHKIGEHLLPAHALVDGGGWQWAAAAGEFTSRVVAGWGLVCLPLGLAVYLPLAFMLRRYMPPGR